MALPTPPKVRPFHLLPGVVLLLIGIGGPVLELIDRQQHPIDVHTVTITDSHREWVDHVGEPGERVRFCDFELSDGTTDYVACPALKGTGDEISVYQGDNDVWRTYQADWFWIFRGAVITLLGAAYAWFWLWSRRYHRRRAEERAHKG